MKPRKDLNSNLSLSVWSTGAVFEQGHSQQQRGTGVTPLLVFCDLNKGIKSADWGRINSDWWWRDLKWLAQSLSTEQAPPGLQSWTMTDCSAFSWLLLPALRAFWWLTERFNPCSEFGAGCWGCLWAHHGQQLLSTAPGGCLSSQHLVLRAAQKKPTKARGQILTSHSEELGGWFLLCSFLRAAFI